MNYRTSISVLCVLFLTIIASASETITHVDTIPIAERIDRSYFERILNDDFRRNDEIHLVRTVQSSESKIYNYEILKNQKSSWELELSTPAEDLEEIFVRWRHNNELYESVQEAVEINRGSYRATPWHVIPPIFKEDSLRETLLNFLAWESGGTATFDRKHLYNFNGAEDDTVELVPDLTKPALYDYRMDLQYTHRLNKIVWVGGGLQRSWQQSHCFDTMQVDREGWFKRMGWNLSVAFPGFKYEIFRDPGLIPYYGQYEDSLYSKLNPDEKYIFLRELNIVEDSIRAMTIDNSGLRPDTSYEMAPYDRIRAVGGIGQRFTLKFGYFNYSLVVQSKVYKAPIQTFMMKDMPFFKGEWDIGLVVVPNGQVIPHLEFDFYRTTIPLGSAGVLGVSPLHFELQVWDRKNFYLSFGFNVDFLMGEATFNEE